MQWLQEDALSYDGSLILVFVGHHKGKREMKDARAITVKNRRPATQVICPACGTKMFRIGKRVERL